MFFSLCVVAGVNNDVAFVAPAPGGPRARDCACVPLTRSQHPRRRTAQLNRVFYFNEDILNYLLL